MYTCTITIYLCVIILIITATALLHKHKWHPVAEYEKIHGGQIDFAQNIVGSCTPRVDHDPYEIGASRQVGLQTCISFFLLIVSWKPIWRLCPVFYPRIWPFKTKDLFWLFVSLSKSPVPLPFLTLSGHHKKASIPLAFQIGWFIVRTTMCESILEVIVVVWLFDRIFNGDSCGFYWPFPANLSARLCWVNIMSW